MTGTLDATGEVVDVNYGFTATSVSPAILFGSVKGKVESSKADYIAKSDRQFDVTVDDATYGRILAKVAEWRDREQPSYSLNKRNCVHFVMELAETVGLKVNRKRSEEHTSELQSLMRISYAVFCLKNKNKEQY